MIWLVSTVHFSPSAWLDSSYDRHAGKRTITGKVRWLSRGETHLARLWLRELPAALWTSYWAVKSLLEYLRRPKWIPTGPLTSLSLQKHFLTSEGERQLGVNNSGCMWGVRRKQKKIASFVDETWIWYVCVFISGWYTTCLGKWGLHFSHCLFVGKSICIILVENSLRAALQISSNTHIGNVEIWKMPTFSPRKELICWFPWRGNYWKDWFC